MYKSSKLIKKTVILLVVSMLIVVSGCDYGNDDYDAKTTDTNPSRNSSGTSSGPAVSLDFRYPAKDLTISVKEGKRTVLTVEINGKPKNYQWQVNKGENWENVPGNYGNTKHYTTDSCNKENENWKYRCIVIATDYSNKSEKTLTSFVFSLKIEENSSTSSSSSKPASSSSSQSSTSSEKTVYEYTCNGCNYKTTSVKKAKEHQEDNKDKKGHGGYETKTKTVGGEKVYHCGNADCTMPINGKPYYTQKTEELNIHLEDCPAHNEFVSNGYRCSCGEILVDEQDKNYHLENNSQSHIVSNVPWICTTCAAVFGNNTEKQAHNNANLGKAGKSTIINATTQKWYYCKGCDFKTTSKSEIKKHDDENQTVKGHGGFKKVERKD